LSEASAIIFSMLNNNILIEKIISLKHEENPEIESVEFQAFVNGLNNSLEEVISWLKKQEDNVS
jgi:hypothetical protein